jgi:hypothetical protein
VIAATSFAEQFAAVKQDEAGYFKTEFPIVPNNTQNAL